MNTTRAGLSNWPPKNPQTPLAVLCSGGLDSAILLCEAIRSYPKVTPIYVRTGLLWEDAELGVMRKFLAAIRCPSLQNLVILDEPIQDVYGLHWSISGDGVPQLGADDSESYLPGRNVLLLSKPLLWCHLQGIAELATAPLASNPFPDATDEFYDGFAKMISQAVNGSVRVLRPYAAAGFHKEDVIRRGVGLPLELTLSCAKPVGLRHCGRCSKCGERMAGFLAAKIADPTDYATVPDEVS